MAPYTTHANMAEHYIFFLPINMKMPTIVGIFIFISREKFMLTWAKHEKKTKKNGDCFPVGGLNCIINL